MADLPGKNTLVKCTIAGVDAEKRRLNGLTFVGKASKKRMTPDSFSRILQQYMARMGVEVA